MTKPILAALLLGVAALPAHAADPAECGTVRLSDPGWTDITATNGVAAVVLEALGYAPNIATLSVPVGYEALKGAQTDVFLGNWMPAQAAFREDLDADGGVTELAQNLEGAKFTLAVNPAAAALGVADFADLDAHRDAFEGKIYGIEPGAPANQNIARMIAADKFGLGDWELVESSEQGMLAQVQRAIGSEDAILFFGWRPHPMNVRYDLEYLTDGDDMFGPNDGEATVLTNTRKGLSAECPNLGALLANLAFTVEAEDIMMSYILDEGLEPRDAATRWLTENGAVLDGWLEGVTTVDGQPGLAAVTTALDL